MLQITNLTDAAKQRTSVLLSDNTTVVFDFVFHPVTQRWVMDVEHGSKSVKGVALCVHPNVLRSFRIAYPFGLFVQAKDGVDPFDVNDFASGRVELYVLDSTNGGNEVDQIETAYF